MLSWRLVARMLLGKREKTIAITLMIAIAVIGLLLGLSLGLSMTRTSPEDTTDSASTSLPPATPPSSTTSPAADGDSGTPHHAPAHRYNSTYKKYRFAAVTTDTKICSQIGVLELFIVCKLIKYWMHLVNIAFYF